MRCALLRYRTFDPTSDDHDLVLAAVDYPIMIGTPYRGRLRRVIPSGVDTRFNVPAGTEVWVLASDTEYPFLVLLPDDTFVGLTADELPKFVTPINEPAAFYTCRAGLK